MSKVRFLGQVKPEDAEQFQPLHPGKWGLYVADMILGERWFLSPISSAPFDHHVVSNYKWVEEDFGIKELLHVPHKKLLEEVFQNVPDEWKFTNQYGQVITFNGKAYRELLMEEINNPSITDDFI